MQHYITKISSNGRIVLPAEIREKFDLDDGERLIIDLKNNVIHLSTFKDVFKIFKKKLEKREAGRIWLLSLKSCVKRMRRADKIVLDASALLTVFQAEPG